jgi:CDP-glycerol glycerophosphotransferase (TagB/SpsB family)
VSEGDAVEPGEAELSALLTGLRDRGIQLVIKPHPMDAEERRWEGAVTVHDADLVRAGVGAYDLLARSRGLVTDYSSVWVDYMLLDRPLAFFVPDRDSYTRTLVPADVLAWVPGEVVGSADPFEQFLADVDARGGLGAGERTQAAERMGLNATRTAADDLVSELVRRRVLG